MKIPTRRRVSGRGILLVVIGIAALTGCDLPPDRTIDEDYSVFGVAASSADAPQVTYSDDLLADLDIAAQEVRRVGDYQATEFYAGLLPSEVAEDQYRICFFVLAQELEVAGASCSADPYDPAHPTVSVRVAATGGAVQAFLIPDATQLDLAEGWHRASENVVVLTDPAAPAEISGTVAEDTDITLRRSTG